MVSITNTESGLKITAPRADREFNQQSKLILENAIKKMVYEFTQECEVAMRKIKPGESITITGGPLEAHLSIEAEPDEPLKLEHQSA